MNKQEVTEKLKQLGDLWEQDMDAYRAELQKHENLREMAGKDQPVIPDHLMLHFARMKVCGEEVPQPLYSLTQLAIVSGDAWGKLLQATRTMEEGDNFSEGDIERRFDAFCKYVMAGEGFKYGYLYRHLSQRQAVNYVIVDGEKSGPWFINYYLDGSIEYTKGYGWKVLT